MYTKFFKRFFDIVLSFVGMVVLIPIFLVVGIVIFIDDPGPVLFKQKRIGKGKEHFWLHKFRSMKMKTPDVATHLLENPEQYITRSGRIIRRLSIDELPQVYDILIGKMSIIGPRPALWNQDDLIAMRDLCAANDVRPGLTGWAQINGRDELSLEEKVKFDGEYIEALCAGEWAAFKMDCKCFIGTFIKVIRQDGVVEGYADRGLEEKKEVLQK